MNVNRISKRIDTRTAVFKTAARFLVWAALCVATLHSPAVTAQVSQTIGTLASGESVTVTFDVTINSPLSVATTQISVQGTVTYNGGTTVNTDDPETVAANDATVTELNQNFDFGLAPDPPYPTVLASDGARHFIPEGGAVLYLGTTPPGGGPDDGVTLPASFNGGLTATVTVVVTGDATLNAWIDWNANGSWADAGDQIITNLSLTAAGNPHLISVAVPPGVPSGTTFGRFRYSSDSNLLPTGLAADGEVEDYQLTLVADHPPVAGADFLQTDQDQSATLPEVKLLANDSDADGDTITISAVTTPTAQGGSAIVSGTAVLYTPPTGYSGSDSFTYILSDGRGQTALGTVTVTVRDPNDAGNNPARIQNLGGGNFGIQFAGIPLFSYQVQYSDAVTGPWTNFGSPITATATGAVATTDASPQASMRFYRIVSVP